MVDNETLAWDRLHLKAAERALTQTIEELKRTAWGTDLDEVDDWLAQLATLRDELRAVLDGPRSAGEDFGDRSVGQSGRFGDGAK